MNAVTGGTCLATAGGLRYPNPPRLMCRSSHSVHPESNHGQGLVRHPHHRHDAPGGPNDYVFLYAQPQMWPAVAKVLGQPELTEDARFKTVEARWDNRAELNAIVEAWTRQRGKHEVMRLMGDAGVPCGACQDTGEVLADSHLKAREMIVDVDYPTRGTYQTVGCPIKLSDSPVAVSRPPLLGEHTDVLLESLCGVEPDEAKRLRQEGVV